MLDSTCELNITILAQVVLEIFCSLCDKLALTYNGKVGKGR